MRKLFFFIFFIYSVNLQAQFPDIKGKESSGIITIPTATSNVSEVKYEIAKKKIEFSLDKVKTTRDNELEFCEMLTDHSDSGYHFFPTKKDSIVRNKFSLGIELQDFTFNVFDKLSTPEVKLSYLFSKSIDKTTKWDTCKVANNILYELQKSIETNFLLKHKLKKEDLFSPSPNLSTKKKNAIKTFKETKEQLLTQKIDRFTNTYHTLAINPVMTYKRNIYADPTFTVRDIRSTDIGVNTSYSWQEVDYGYGMNSGVALSAYLGYRLNSISELGEKEYCQIDVKGSTIDGKEVEIQKCSEYLTGTPDNTFETIFRIDLSQRITHPLSGEGASFNRPALYALARFEGTFFSNRNDKLNGFAGISLAHSDGQILASVMLKFTDFFKDLPELDFIEEQPLVEVTIGLPIGG